MLNLRLRDEFLGTHTPGTVIDLRAADNSGATQRPATEILEISYPTGDLQTGLRVLAADRPPRPVVLIGDKGRGKSHIMAVMHHAVASPDVVETWARDWGSKTGNKVLKGVTLLRGYQPISEAVHNQEFPLLWDLLFARHPKGAEFKGRFLQSGDPYPARSLIEKMLEAQPIVLILDEFQKWFDGLHDSEEPTRPKWRTVASNFIQNLSEIASDKPHLLVLVVSVLNNNTEAFEQVHRNDPVLINFQGPTAKRDRQKLLLHRLFKNRENIAEATIRDAVSAHAAERARLLFGSLPPLERQRRADEVAECWPFSPELIERLEGHILMSRAAQETRDLIRILAAVYRSRGEAVPLLTPADFFVDDPTCGVQALLMSIAAAEQEDLLAVAHRNLDALESQGLNIPLSREVITSLWMRSMSPDRAVGATRPELHLDCTRDKPIDDNTFRDQLQQIRDGCTNIHGGKDLEGRLWFALHENAETKVRATARNDKLWRAGPADPNGSTATYLGKDIEHIRKTLRAMLVPESKSSVARVIVLGPQWITNPSAEAMEEQDRPDKWTQPVLLVLPDPVDQTAGSIDRVLGKWLATQVPSKRNTVRFLFPVSGATGLFDDREVILSARCSYLTSAAWKDDPQYGSLKSDFDKPLRDALRKRFDRFAVLRRWNFKQPEQCQFSVETVNEDVVKAKGAVPLAIDDLIKRDLFDAAEFQDRVIDYAKTNRKVSDLVDELKEPPPTPDDDAIPFLGETPVMEEICKVAAKGKIVLNVSGQWVGRLPEHADDDEALKFIRPRAFRSPQEMRQVQMCLPGAAGGTSVTGATTVPLPPTPVPTTLFGGENGPQPTGTQSGVTVPVSPTPNGQPQVGPRTPAAVPESEPITLFTPCPTTVVNLLGFFEQQGMANDAALDSATLTFQGLSVQQVKQILQKIPSAQRAALSVTYKKPDAGTTGGGPPA